jgi:hypothetical protein
MEHGFEQAPTGTSRHQPTIQPGGDAIPYRGPVDPAAPFVHLPDRIKRYRRHRGDLYAWPATRRPTGTEGLTMSTEKYVEFDLAQRTYRIKVRLDNTYDIHGFNSLTQQVGIYEDLNSGDKVFVNWSAVPALRFTDAVE